MFTQSCEGCEYLLFSHQNLNVEKNVITFFIFFLGGFYDPVYISLGNENSVGSVERNERRLLVAKRRRKDNTLLD